MVVKLERKRYFLVEFMGIVPEKRDLIYALREKYSYLFGQFDLASSSLHVIDIMNKFAIIRSTHDSRDRVEVTIQLLNLPNSPIPVVRHVSGSIKKISSIININVEDYRNDD